MRAFAWAVVALALTGPSAAATSALDDLLADPGVHGLERHLAAPRGHGALAEAAQRTLAPPAAAPQAAGPFPAGPALAEAGRSLLLGALALGGALAGLGVVGWRHVHRTNALDHPGRALLLAEVRAHPGLHLRALARAAAIPVQRAAYHLDQLERLGLVASQDLGGKRCYHEAGAGAEVRRALHDAALAPRGAARDVLAFVEGHPGVSQSEVARRLGMLPGRARWHLRRLAAQGALDEAQEGQARTYRPKAGPKGPGP